jgi:cellulose synthase/poly-beta-1,6-N-acetylglucosamine synthase-like glycosyltransferase
MKITIGIPVFNCETWVATAIQSALEQTWPDKEIIIVDDGSTDGSADICKSFGSRILFVQQPNRGGNAARNHVCKLSSGDWVQFLDADDYLKPDKVRSQIAACSELAKVDVLCSATVYESWVNGQRAGEAADSLVENCDWFKLWFTWSMPQTGACLWRKEALKEIGGWNEQVRCNQDYELYLRAFQKGLRFQLAGTPLAVYRIWSENTVCRRDKKSLVLGKTELVQGFLQWLKSEGRWTPDYQRLAGRSCFEMARILANEDLTLATWYYRERKREGLMQSEGAPLAPWRYRLALKCLGFSGAERLARSLREAKRVLSRQNSLQQLAVRH